MSVGALSWARDLSRYRDVTLDGGDVTFFTFGTRPFRGNVSVLTPDGGGDGGGAGGGREFTMGCDRGTVYARGLYGRMGVICWDGTCRDVTCKDVISDGRFLILFAVGDVMSAMRRRWWRWWGT